MTSLTVNGSAGAATTLAAAGKMFAATGGTSGSTTTKISSAATFRQLVAIGTTTATSNASIPAPTDSNFAGWIWDVTTLEGQRIAAGTWAPTFHLTASTAVTVTPTVAWYKRSSAGVYTLIGSVTGSSTGSFTASTLLTFTPPSLSLMDFATGDKLCMWLWVQQTAGGATNSTIGITEAISGSSLGISSEAQAATPGYAPTPVALSVTMAGVGVLTPTMAAKVAFTVTMAGVGVLTPTMAAKVAFTVTMAGVGSVVVDPYGAEVYGVRLYSTETLTLTTALTNTLAGVSTLTPSLSAAVSLTAEMDGVGTLTMSAPSLSTALTDTLPGTGSLTGTLFASLALTATISGDSTLTGAVTHGVSFTATIAGIGALIVSNPTVITALSLDCAGQGMLLGTVTYIVYAFERVTTWQTRDLSADWQTRDLTSSWQTRDLETTWKE